MSKRPLLVPLCLLVAVAPVPAQEINPTQSAAETDRPAAVEGSPLYHVDVVARTTQAVNYGHRSLTTDIGLAGTVLAPRVEGRARVRNSGGATEIKAKLKSLPAPQRYGAEYLTYVLWAVTPQGRAVNLGEIFTDGDWNGKLQTAVELQTFALLVTAEPYYAVTQPSDVVVAENVLLPETIGKIETVAADYELLKRGRYRFDRQAADQRDRERERAKKISKKEYDMLVEIYQARSAVQWARAEGAAEFASDALARAERQLKQAESGYEREASSGSVISIARAATQTAEDARLITSRKRGREMAANDRPAL